MPPYLLNVIKSNSLNNEADYANHVHCERSLRQIHEEMKFYLDQQLDVKFQRLSRSIDERQTLAMKHFHSENISIYRTNSGQATSGRMTGAQSP